MPIHARCNPSEAKRLVPLCLVIASVTFPTSAQDRTLHQAIELSYSAMGLTPPESISIGSVRYLGAGAGYRLMLKPWIGLDVQATKYPQNQAIQNAGSGGAVFLANGDLLAGHRWSTIGLYGEVGGGRFHTAIFKGVTSQIVPVFASRNYADLQAGGLIEAWLSRRWSVTFAARDNLLFAGPYYGISPNGPTYGAARTFNAPEGRSGVAFHF